MLIMKRTGILIITLFTLTVLLACKDAPPDPVTVKNLNVKEGHDLIEKNKNNPDFVILDVRTPGEFNSGHIQNAINIDYKASDFKDNISNLDKNKTYALYCRSGRRAVASSDIMSELGFQHIYQFGGIKEWQEAGYKLTPPENQ